MEGGEVTVICVDTSITNICWFHDQINAVEMYCHDKIKDDPNNLVGIVTSTKLVDDSYLPPTSSLELVAYRLNSLEARVLDYTDLSQELSGLGWFDEYKERKKRLVVFSGSPLLSTSAPLTQVIANFLKPRRVVLDIFDFGPRFKDEEGSEAKSLEPLHEYMNHNNDENGNSRYFLFQDDGFSLSYHISRLLMMDGEVTMICVDTSITSLSRFNDEINAVEIYCRRKLQAHPKSFVSIARFGQRDLGIFLYPTNCLEIVTSKLRGLYPLKQEYTDLRQGFDVDWFDQQDMEKRIVVFSGSPLHSTTEPPTNIAHLLKKRGVVLDVVVFGKDEEDRRAKYFKALVESMDHNNDENERSRYYLIEDDGYSRSHHISVSSILPLIAAEEEAPISLTHVEENIPCDLASDYLNVDSGWLEGEGVEYEGVEYEEKVGWN